MTWHDWHKYCGQLCSSLSTWHDMTDIKLWPAVLQFMYMTWHDMTDIKLCPTLLKLPPLYFHFSLSWSQDRNFSGLQLLAMCSVVLCGLDWTELAVGLQWSGEPLSSERVQFLPLLFMYSNTFRILRRIVFPVCQKQIPPSNPQVLSAHTATVWYVSLLSPCF
jgi:hypothetical protein